MEIFKRNKKAKIKAEKKSLTKTKNSTNKKTQSNVTISIKNKSSKTDKKKPINIGQTLESNDLYLPYKENKKPKSKSRPVIVVDKNKKEEFVVIPGSTQETKNTTKYGKYGIDYYRHNIEIEDNEGKPITLNTKFQITKKSTILPEKEATKIYDKVLNHTKFSSENKKKIEQFKNKHKKSKR